MNGLWVLRNFAKNFSVLAEMDSPFSERAINIVVYYKVDNVCVGLDYTLFDKMKSEEGYCTGVTYYCP